VISSFFKYHQNNKGLTNTFHKILFNALIFFFSYCRDSVASVRRLSLSSSSDKIPLETNKADTMVLQNSKAKSMNGAKSSKESTPVVMNPIDPKTMLFFEAIPEGSIQKTKAILRGKNMNMNTRDLNDKNTPTALIVACEVNNTEIVKLLLTMKKARILDVNQEDKVGRRPIW
jgi:hypothetical protein